MKFIKNLSEKEYKNFFESQKEAHFLQSYEWGQTQKDGRGLIPCYVGVKDDKNKILACALLLKRTTPLNMCYFYAPRGFVIDYHNEELFTFFAESLKKFLKEENAIYLKVDPGVKYQDINENAERIAGENNKDIFDNFIKKGFIHKGFYKLYEGNQPRYTIRVHLNKDKDEIIKNISKTYLNTIKRSYSYDLEIEEGNDIDIMHDLILNNAQKDGFHAYSYDYYRSFYKHFHESGHVKLLNIRLYPDKIIKKDKDELKDLKAKIKNGEIKKKNLADAQDRVKRLEKDLEIFKPYAKQYPKGKIVCSAAVTYTNYASWLLYLGNDNLGERTFAVNRCYYEALNDAIDKGLKFFDLFGTVGDPKTTYKKLAGLHEFKRKFGGEYIEFLGEFDLVNKPFWYKVLPTLLKIYRRIKK